MKTFSVIIAAALTGGLIGYILRYGQAHDVSSALQELYLPDHTSKVMDDAYQAYLTQIPEVGIWALERAAEHLSLQKQSKVIDNFLYPKDLIDFDLMLIYGRLSKLERDRDPDKYQEYISKALAYGLSFSDSEPLSETRILEMVEQVDDISREHKPPEGHGEAPRP